MASKLLLVTVFLLDLIAFGLAVAAEQRRSTVSFLIRLFSLVILDLLLFFTVKMHTLICEGDVNFGIRERLLFLDLR